MNLNVPAQPGDTPLQAAHMIACQAFALCDRAAVGSYPHPILGAVLSCQRCADKLGESLSTVGVEV